MNDYDTSETVRMLPQVAVATALVLGLPVALVWWLRAEGVVASGWVCVVLAVALSILVSGVASAIWKRCEGSERVVFSELLLWGWLRRLRVERQLANLLGQPGDLPNERDANDSTAEPSGEFLAALATAVDAQDPYTEGHSRRVAQHAAMVARELKLPDDEVQRIRTAAALHDIGKLSVPAALLSKRDVLTPEEFEVVKRHATEGAAMVAGLGDDELTAIVRHHHERFDGTGYPAGLRGDEIPLGARIIAVADTFDAITSLRPYRTAARHKQALDVLVHEAATQLDPAVVRAFLRYYSGRNRSALLVVLAVVPQRLFAWTHGNAGATGNVAFGELAATVAGVATVSLAAMGTAAAVTLNHAPRHPVGAHQRLAAAAVSGAPRTSKLPSSPAKSFGGTAYSAASSSSVIRRARVGNTNARRAASPGSASASRPPARTGKFSAALAPSTTGAGDRQRGGSGSGSNGMQPLRPAGRHPGAGGGSGGPSSQGSGHRPADGSGTQTLGSSAPKAGTPPTPTAPATGTPATPVGPITPGLPTGTPTGSPSGTPTGSPTGTPTGTPTGPSSSPTTKDQCKNGGYVQFGFTNQGQCIAGVQSHGH